MQHQENGPDMLNCNFGMVLTHHSLILNQLLCKIELSFELTLPLFSALDYYSFSSISILPNLNPPNLALLCFTYTYFTLKAQLS